MSKKDAALETIAALAREHDITLEDLASLLGRQEVEVNKKSWFTLNRVFSYLGGIFILAGLCGMVAILWESLNPIARIVITLGPGLVFLVLAGKAASLDQPGKNVTVYTLLSAIFQSTGLYVAVYEFSTGGGDIRLANIMICGVLALQYGFFFRQFRRTSMLFFALVFAYVALASLLDMLKFAEELTILVCGASLFAITYGLQRTPYNSICGFGYFVSSIALLWVGFDVLEGTPMEILYLGIAGFMLYVSTIVRSRSVLITSAIAIFAFISYFTSEYFLDSVGWPIFLILLGMIFFGISNLVVKLNKRIKA